ncbi:MAG: N-acetyltransferase [Faecalimonas sp.]|nr:N-acetyltransferase [Faecalimonas sp.]
MNYLKEKDLLDIEQNVRLFSVDEIEDISHYLFDSKIEEYNEFLNKAKLFSNLNISKTFLLVHKYTDELIAYMTLSADSIKLTTEEKDMHEIGKVPYASIAALKIGKLAVNKGLSDIVKRKGYGSFMLDLARAYAFEMNKLGIACRFITVDADIEYDENTPEFYKKNGFVENLSNRSRNASHTISMRKDIFSDD